MLPKPFWLQLLDAFHFDVQVPLDHRVRALLKEYGGLDKEFLITCTDRIRKRLGTEQTKQAIAAIREDRMEDFIRVVLVYYDKTYRRGLTDRDSSTIMQVFLSGEDLAANARLLLNTAETRKAPLSV